jgi:hypothetical protein
VDPEPIEPVAVPVREEPEPIVPAPVPAPLVPEPVLVAVPARGVPVPVPVPPCANAVTERQNANANDIAPMRISFFITCLLVCTRSAAAVTASRPPCFWLFTRRERRSVVAAPLGFRRRPSSNGWTVV